MYEWFANMLNNPAVANTAAGTTAVDPNAGFFSQMFSQPGTVFSGTPIVGQAAAGQGAVGAVEGSFPAWKDPAVLASVLGTFGAALAPQGSWQQSLGSIAGGWGGNQLYSRAAQNTMAANQPGGMAPYQSPLQPTPIMTGSAMAPPTSNLSTMLPNRTGKPSLLPVNLSSALSGYGMQPPPMIDTNLLGRQFSPGGF